MAQLISINSRVVYSVLFYALLMILILTVKPSIMFTNNKEIKQFGVSEEKTMFSLGVFTVVIAIISFYTFCIIDIIFKNP